MFVLYIFIYRVARALEQRSKVNADRISKAVGLSLSKNRRLATTNPLGSLSFRKLGSKANVELDEDAANGLIDHFRLNFSIHRTWNFLDAGNRSSSNENSAEHGPIGQIPSNFLTVEISSKKLDENRSLLRSSQDPAVNNQHRSLIRSRSRSKARKALRTITVIMGAFVLCWTPVTCRTSIDRCCFSFSFSF